MLLRRGIFALFLAGGLAAGGCGLLGTAAVDSDRVEQRISEDLERQFGDPPADVDCPEDLEATLSASMRCVITAEDGTQIGVTVIVTGIDGSTVHFEFEVDDEPLP